MRPLIRRVIQRPVREVRLQRPLPRAEGRDGGARGPALGCIARLGDSKGAPGIGSARSCDMRPRQLNTPKAAAPKVRWNSAERAWDNHSSRTRCSARNASVSGPSSTWRLMSGPWRRTGAPAPARPRPAWPGAACSGRRRCKRPGHWRRGPRCRRQPGWTATPGGAAGPPAGCRGAGLVFHASSHSFICASVRLLPHSTVATASGSPGAACSRIAAMPTACPPARPPGLLEQAASRPGWRGRSPAPRRRPGPPCRSGTRAPGRRTATPSAMVCTDGRSISRPCCHDTAPSNPPFGAHADRSCRGVGLHQQPTPLSSEPLPSGTPSVVERVARQHLAGDGARPSAMRSPRGRPPPSRRPRYPRRSAGPPRRRPVVVAVQPHLGPHGAHAGHLHGVGVGGGVHTTSGHARARHT